MTDDAQTLSHAAAEDLHAAAVEYAKAARLGDEAARHAATIKLRAERKAGELLKRLERDQGRAGQERCPTSDNVPSPYAAALSVAGMRDHRPPAREHAAEVALHALAPLTPHVSLVTAASAEHARRQLLDTEG